MSVAVIIVPLVFISLYIKTKVNAHTSIWDFFIHFPLIFNILTIENVMPGAILEFNKQFFQIVTFNPHRLKLKSPDYLQNKKEVKSRLSDVFYSSVMPTENLGNIYVLTIYLPILILCIIIVRQVCKKVPRLSKPLNACFSQRIHHTLIDFFASTSLT